RRDFRVAAFFCAACHASAAIVWNQFLLSFFRNPRQGSVCSFHERTARIRFRTTRGGSLAASRNGRETCGGAGGSEGRMLIRWSSREEGNKGNKGPTLTLLASLPAVG